jgi:hypothetical protein
MAEPAVRIEHDPPSFRAIRRGLGASPHAPRAACARPRFRSHD